MKRYMRAMVLICGLMLAFGPGYMGLYAGDAENNPDTAESIEQLPPLIEKALKENDIQKLEEIKKNNQELVRENLSLIVQKCNTLIEEGIKNELSGESEKGEINFKIAWVIAEIYQLAYNNSYLLDKVNLFSKWGKFEKEKYLEAEKIYAQGDEDRTKYSYETAILSYNKGLTLYHETGYKEGEAKCLKGLGDVYRETSNYEKAYGYYKDALSLQKVIGNRYGVPNLLPAGPNL